MARAKWMPALLTSTSRPPKAASVAATARSTSARTDTSPSMPSTLRQLRRGFGGQRRPPRPPSERRPIAVESATAAPAAANFFAVARPMPFAAPGDQDALAGEHVVDDPTRPPAAARRTAAAGVATRLHRVLHRPPDRVFAIADTRQSAAGRSSSSPRRRAARQRSASTAFDAASSRIRAARWRGTGSRPARFAELRVERRQEPQQRQPRRRGSARRAGWRTNDTRHRRRAARPGPREAVRGPTRSATRHVAGSV